LRSISLDIAQAGNFFVLKRLTLSVIFSEVIASQVIHLFRGLPILFGFSDMPRKVGGTLKMKFTGASVLVLGLVVGCATLPAGDTNIAADWDPLPASTRTLDMFKAGPDQACYDRETMPATFVVDSHNHFRPFGGKSRPYSEVVAYMENSGVLFANMYGIGQSLPWNSGCTYYLDCVGTPADPSIKNDMINANNLANHKPEHIELTLSMTFPDLANPSDIAETMDTLNEEYPGLWKWMGEVNLVKQALMGNDHEAATLSDIANWAPFMAKLRAADMPIAIHSDLGSNDDQTKYLHLMDEVLERYPENKIIWVHMGLSKELTNIPADQHIALMSERLDKSPSLMLDITWRVIADNYFQTEKNKAAYTAFFNKYYDRILTGTDFVASFNKSFEVYAEEVEVNSTLLEDLDDRAFRYITLGQAYFDLLDLPYRAPDVCRA
tara:strand:- start:3607 stop:4917 length:1311 start_codon:yes stop_codon:yes gene_type:complete